MKFGEKSLRRSERRSEREKHIARAHGFVRTFWVKGPTNRLSLEECERQARHFALRLHRNRKKCSCWGCSKARHWLKGDRRFNHQELCQREKARYELANFERGEQGSSA